MNRSTQSKGLTLTELLVVVAIVVLVAGVTVPMMRPLLKGRNVREAARIVNVAFASAKAAAVEKQRPVGIWMERAEHASPTLGYSDLTAMSAPPTLTTNMYKVFKLYTAVQPPPYSGDSLTARARVITANENSIDAVGIPAGLIPPTPMLSTVVIPLQDAVSAAAILNPGEKIQFGGRGYIHTIMNRPQVLPSTGPPLPIMRAPFDKHAEFVWFYIRTLPDGVNQLPSLYPTYSGLSPAQKLNLDTQAIQRYLGRLQGETVSFEIFRNPRKSTAAPIDMPNGTTIDLFLSGIDEDNRTKFRYGDGASEVHPGQDIVIMFDPTGRVRVHYINSDRAFRETKFGNMPNAASPVFALSQSREVQKNVTLMIAREANVGSGLDNLPALNYSCESAVEATTQLPPESLANLADSSTIWLTINEQRVTNTPNLGFDPTVPGDPASSLTRFLFYDVHIRHARQLSRSGLSMGVE